MINIMVLASLDRGTSILVTCHTIPPERVGYSPQPYQTTHSQREIVSSMSQYEIHTPLQLTPTYPPPHTPHSDS